jgi:predicted HTH transcriptional regulator
VHDTHDWVDRRFLTWPYAITPEPGVTTQDPGPALEALVAGGEGPAVEFKREIPVLREARWRVARTISAFANADGGTILFGIDDDGTPAPLSAADAAPTALDSVANWVRDIVAPLPDFTVTMHAAPGGLGSIVALIIGPGVSPPYGVDPANPRYYIRRGATTFPASADQVRALARSRPDADQLSGLTFMR